MMKLTKTNAIRVSRPQNGFTLTELLVVIAIIATLAAISLMATSRIRLAAAKATSVSQMKNISVGIASWMGDNSSPEPFYVSTGTGDYPHEGGNGKTMKPGNFASALYNRTDPSAGYLLDHTVFYSPLAKLPNGIPKEADYNPTAASNARPWGTFWYVYPHVTEGNRTARQLANDVGFVGASRASIDGMLVMTEFYEGDWVLPKFKKEAHHALLSDWSVQFVSDTNAGFNQWRTGN